MGLTRWERLEEYLVDKDLVGGSFTAREYASDMDFDDVAEATQDIQYYLRAQRRLKKNKTSRTLFVLHRRPHTRTSNARWEVGVRTADARAIGKSLTSDTRRRVERAFQPDLLALKAHNPRVGRLVQTQIDMVIDGALKILDAASQGSYDRDEE